MCAGRFNRIGVRKELSLLDGCLDVGLTVHMQTCALSISTYAKSRILLWNPAYMEYGASLKFRA